MDYPGHVITAGADAVDVAAVVNQLASLGYQSAAGKTEYDDALASLVKLFQSQHVDAMGRPLHADGEVGPLTWGSLFGAAADARPAAGLAAAALQRAITQIGVREQPLGSNRGPEVDDYCTTAGVGVGSFWCMAFVYWCFKHGANDAGLNNTFPKTASCVDAWTRVKTSLPARVITRQQALVTPSLVRPGAVFILDFGGGEGHTGFVRQAAGAALITVEGNSNNDGSRNGVGVFELNRRTVTDSTLRGFLDFTT